MEADNLISGSRRPKHHLTSGWLQYMSIYFKSFWIYFTRNHLIPRSPKKDPHFAITDWQQRVGYFGLWIPWLAVAWSHTFLKVTNFVLNNSISSGKPIKYNKMAMAMKNPKLHHSKVQLVEKQTHISLWSSCHFQLPSGYLTLINSLLWKPWPIYFDDWWFAVLKEADFQIGDWYWLEKKRHISTSNGGQLPHS